MVKVERGCLPEGGVRVDREIVSEKTYSVGHRTLGQRPPSRNPAERRATVRLSKMASLSTITLLSVGLWAAIWVAANSVAGVWLR
jgi:hypothetical protein